MPKLQALFTAFPAPPGQPVGASTDATQDYNAPKTPTTKPLELWKMMVSRSRMAEEAYFPEAKNYPWPIGTKNQAVSMEQALRHVYWFGDYKEDLEDYAKEHNGMVIGDGIVAPPPCDPQPVCQLMEGSAMDPSIALALTLKLNSAIPTSTYSTHRGTRFAQ